jgi:hypothetical protein
LAGLGGDVGEEAAEAHGHRAAADFSFALAVGGVFEAGNDGGELEAAFFVGREASLVEVVGENAAAGFFGLGPLHHQRG